MIPPTFHIGDEVLVTGPSIMDCKFHIGKRFTIEQIDRDKYSSYGLPYYPASSLQLVNKKPLSPMRITYNYKPDDCEHGTFQVSCPCGRKVEIDPNWPKLDEELKIGDFVEVIGSSNCGHIDHVGHVFRITEMPDIFTWTKLPCYSTECEYPYPATSLRKLTPEEITKHLAPKSVSPKLDWEVMIMRRVVDSEKRLTAIEKRLDFVEKFQREQFEYRRGMLWMAGP
jgi:hypothetical protein